MMYCIAFVSIKFVRLSASCGCQILMALRTVRHTHECNNPGRSPSTVKAMLISESAVNKPRVIQTGRGGNMSERRKSKNPGTVQHILPCRSCISQTANFSDPKPRLSKSKKSS